MNTTGHYLAFTESDALTRHKNAFIRAVEDNPQGDHSDKARAMMNQLVDELVTTFFDGPIEASGARGGLVSAIRSAASVVRKTGQSTSGRLVARVEPGEAQQALARHLGSHRVERSGETLAMFPLSPGTGEQVVRAFDEVLGGRRDMSDLMTAMKGIADDALAHYLDRVMEPIELNRFSRSMVSTARGTIRKAAYSGIEKGLPGMPWKFREPVVRYFHGMLTAVPAH